MPSTLMFVGLPENSKSSIIKMNMNESDSGSHFTFTDEYNGPGCNKKEIEGRPYSANNKERVPNAPKSSIGEIFSTDCPDGRIQKKNGISSSRPRALRDTPVKPKDTHSRLFGQASSNTVVPMVTDTIRSNIQFGEGATNGHMNGHSPLPSPTKVVFNGTGTTPSREGNPITGDGYKEKKQNGPSNRSSNSSVNLILYKRVPPGGYSSGLW